MMTNQEAIACSVALTTAMLNDDYETTFNIIEDVDPADMKWVIAGFGGQITALFEQLSKVMGIDVVELRHRTLSGTGIYNAMHNNPQKEN